MLYTAKVKTKNIIISTNCLFNPLSTNNDKNETSLYFITTCSNIQVMRIEEVIIKDKRSIYLDKFFLLVPLEMYGEP